jgi:hypothetical protein
MKIKNNYKAPLGFEKTTVLPGAVGTLPKAYTAEHPAIKRYLKLKWIEVVSENTAKKAANTGGGTKEG